ncbi:MAG: hypothetical protein M1118_07910, partial [Chloroflexi bacterium]|nr:hypothetical protein [Chloroflexota bacterium]
CTIPQPALPCLRLAGVDRVHSGDWLHHPLLHTTACHLRLGGVYRLVGVPAPPSEAWDRRPYPSERA